MIFYVSKETFFIIVFDNERRLFKMCINDKSINKPLLTRGLYMDASTYKFLGDQKYRK